MLPLAGDKNASASCWKTVPNKEEISCSSCITAAFKNFWRRLIRFTECFLWACYLHSSLQSCFCLCGSKFSHVLLQIGNGGAEAVLYLSNSHVSPLFTLDARVSHVFEVFLSLSQIHLNWFYFQKNTNIKIFAPFSLQTNGVMREMRLKTADIQQKSIEEWQKTGRKEITGERRSRREPLWAGWRSSSCFL